MSGAAAGTAVGFCAPNGALSMVCVAAAAIAALGPDIDHPRSHASQVLGPVSWLVCRTVRGLSRVVGLPAHRGLSHTVVAGVVVGAAVAVVLLKLEMSVTASVFVGAAVTVGWLTALVGDFWTKTTLPHRWWPFIAAAPGPPRWLRITTGKWVESVIMWLVFVPALVFGLHMMVRV